MTVLRAATVTRRIGERAVVAGVDLGLDRGEAVSLVGPSGCGKTTLLSMLGLLDRPDAGAVTFGVDDAWALSSAARARLRLARVGFVFQHHNLFEGLSLLDNVALPAWRLGHDRGKAAARAHALLERLGLARVASTKAGAVSGGEAQRAAVARAMINEPAVLLADEPTGNLDSASAKRVMDALFEVRERGSALLVATHDAAVAARADRHLVMLDGRLV